MGQHERIEEFHERFKALVREFCPAYPATDEEALFLCQMQDKLSCYSPFIWED